MRTSRRTDKGPLIKKAVSGNQRKSTISQYPLKHYTGYTKAVWCFFDCIPYAEQKKLSHSLRCIEVKGRTKYSAAVTVTRNEIITALNKSDEFILAIVEVDGAAAHTIYLKNPFRGTPEFAAASVNYDIQKLINGSEIVYP